MKEWVKWVLLGVLSVAFGIFVLANSVAASIAVATLTGILFLISGGFQIYGGWTADTTGNKLFSIALGALMVLVGASFLFNPLSGVISLALLVVIMLAVSGVVRIVFSWRMKETPFYWPMLISGALSVLLAAYILANFATASTQLLGILLGVELIFNGAGLIVLGFFIRNIRDRLRG